MSWNWFCIAGISLSTLYCIQRHQRLTGDSQMHLQLVVAAHEHFAYWLPVSCPPYKPMVPSSSWMSTTNALLNIITFDFAPLRRFEIQIIIRCWHGRYVLWISSRSGYTRLSWVVHHWLNACDIYLSISSSHTTNFFSFLAIVIIYANSYKVN